MYGSGLPYLDARLSIARLFTGCEAVDERVGLLYPFDERVADVRAVDPAE